ncbi:hypothetical protein D9615_010170 [Tricholomella constricta]|uniref:Uncharacterized protein n=1 Tax=Tricholomella constricta TaxID=117010 RepID=A0A8H5GRZ0_9AGAR|nr:hypothetical protein D9615_010170 [Tricholomella constricta]
MKKKRDSDAAELSSASGSKKRRAPLTRRERAMIRILAQYHVNRLAIARRMDCSIVTVYNVLRRVTAVYDEGDEWDFVDQTFKKEYPPRNSQATSNRSGPSDAGISSSPSSPVISKKEKDTAQSAQSARSTASQVTLVDVNAAHALPETPTKGGKSPRGRTKADHGSSAQRPILVDLDADESEVEELRAPFPGMAEFLAGLEHDLSVLHRMLDAQDLGTTDKLFAFANWPEKDLHQMFREALPHATVAQRYMLVKGVKKYEGAL